MKIKDPKRLRLDIIKAVRARDVKPTVRNIVKQLPVSNGTFYRMTESTPNDQDAPRFDLLTVESVANFIGVDVYEIAEDAE